MSSQRRGVRGRVSVTIGTLVLTLVLTLAALVAPQPALAQSFSFGSVRVEGNQRIETATILSYLGFSQGETVSAGQLNDAGQRIRDTGLFETVDIQVQGGTLVIAVAEFPTINQIGFEGNNRLRDDELAAVIRSEERRVYSPAQAERDVAAITAAYADSGRVNATVVPQIIERTDNRVDLVFEVFEGGLTEVERISFVGNRFFTDRRLRGVLETKQAGLLGFQNTAQPAMGEEPVADEADPFDLRQAALEDFEDQVDAIVGAFDDLRHHGGVDPARIGIGRGDRGDVALGLGGRIDAPLLGPDDGGKFVVAQPVVALETDLVDGREFRDRDHQGAALDLDVDGFEQPGVANALTGIVELSGTDRLALRKPQVGQDRRGLDPLVALDPDRSEAEALRQGRLRRDQRRKGQDKGQNQGSDGDRHAPADAPALTAHGCFSLSDIPVDLSYRLGPALSKRESAPQAARPASFRCGGAQCPRVPTKAPSARAPKIVAI